MDKIASHPTQKRQELSLEQTIWQNTEPSSQRMVGETLRTRFQKTWNVVLNLT